ncbi:LysR family transcriptional regulator [Bordetella sp. BOR01]|uniref:LysR family transcriptional regulator n=1 Tax=Bordetella sp. BOR01 TaxID=2854779 RepID=UPI001C47251E|nr:LysR family transcriptional regulator [Bordetella sp. BOR01]MBV7481386.1 LysR family transcriptional regulator [Bordetella sp. BOR01]
MLTIKQLQAYYWVARLGTLSRAAEKLHITQSAVTKRMQEVQAAAARPLFEGKGRNSRLTQFGRELEAECRTLFELLKTFDELKSQEHQPVRLLRVGLTEMVALTWFADFLRRMKRMYPFITVQPEIDLSLLLQDKVEEGRLDFSIVPDVMGSDTMVKVGVGEVQFGWFAAPGVFAPGSVHSLQELMTQPVIEQSENSVITAACSRLWESVGASPERIYGGNNVKALAGLISAGVGISCLPIALFKNEVRTGTLELVKTSTPAPSVSYSCCFLKNSNATLGYRVSEVARECSTFTRHVRARMQR